ncbi:MAG: GxxExxY protein [Limisphaerales bacterium]
MNTDGSNASQGQERDPITHDIIGAAYEVHRVLGYGFLEKVYQRAMQVELKRRGRNAGLEHRIPVHYKGEGVGEYAADLLVDGKVLVELKVAPEYQTADEAQLLNELKATGFKVGLLINFGRLKVDHKRMIF